MRQRGRKRRTPSTGRVAGEVPNVDIHRSAGTAQMTASRSPRLATTREVAEILGCTPRQVLNRGRAGDLPGRIELWNGVVRFDIDIVEAWVCSRYADQQDQINGPAALQRPGPGTGNEVPMHLKNTSPRRLP